jgi:hypothetical protein
MTLVFSTRAGPLTSIQIGAVDVATIFSTAHTAYGWIGGLDGARFLLSKIPNPLSKKLRELQLDKNVRLLPTNVHILTGGGPLKCLIDNADEAFGGDVRTQLLGLTICALAHECGGGTAVELFMSYLAPSLFDGANELTDILHSQLNEDTVLQRILNEGSSRGLTDLFVTQVENLNLPLGDREWLQSTCGGDPDSPLTTEAHMVGGLLKWIGRDSTEVYFTRSGLVARVATYLKAIGYLIGSIKIWDGQGDTPRRLGPRSIVLVLGGSSETDPLMVDPEDIVDEPLQLHYTYRTVGALLQQALPHQPDVYPEVLQIEFEKIYEYIKSHLQIRYNLQRQGVLEDVIAISQWQPPRAEPTAIERSLAALYFPLSAENTAPCYSGIATARTLEQVKNKERREAVCCFEEVAEEITRFRATTAAIVLSIASHLASGDFKNIRHSTTLALGSEAWLEPMCKLVDQLASGSFSLSNAVCTLSAVHAALEPDPAVIRSSGLRKVIGWRTGIYSVIPSLLLEMVPARTAVGLSCKDVYIANVRAHADGSLQSSVTRAILAENILDDLPGDGNLSSLVRLHSPRIGRAESRPPDVPLHLSIERPMHYGEPDICIAGRINGSIVGTVGVLDVLKVLIRSLDEPENCSHGHESTVITIEPSRWATNRRVKPVGTAEIPAFIPVQGDPCWALFIAGCTASLNGRIVFRCLNCAKELAAQRVSRRRDDHAVLIGYV